MRAFFRDLLIGMASLFDFEGALQRRLEDVCPWYDPNKTAAENDAEAIRQDWKAIGF